MTNKEFQEILTKFPDDYTIQLDNSFGWETPSNKNKVDPHFYVNHDCGFIEIEPPEMRKLWIKTLPLKECKCVVAIPYEDRKSFSDIAVYLPETKVFSTWNSYEDCEETYKPEELLGWFEIPEYDK